MFFVTTHCIGTKGVPFLAVINKFLNYFGQILVSDFVWVYPPAKT